MLQLIYYAIVGVAAGVAALIGATLMKDVQHRVARWLQEQHLEQSKLMEAVLLLDQVGSSIRVSVRVMVAGRPAQVLKVDKTYKVTDIKDQQTLAELRRRQHAEQNVLSLFTQG